MATPTSTLEREEMAEGVVHVMILGLKGRRERGERERGGEGRGERKRKGRMEGKKEEGREGKEKSVVDGAEREYRHRWSESQDNVHMWLSSTDKASKCNTTSEHFEISA